MKIAILTFSHTSNMNYGAMLQSYALYKTIERIGYNPYIIDWKIKGKRRLKFNDLKYASPFYIIKFLKRIIGFVFYPFYFRIALCIGELPFKQFSTFYLKNKTEKLKKNQLHRLNDSMDAFIVGSDQVWRYKTCPDLKTFFLNFVNEEHLKIAYSASFGVDRWEAPEKITKTIKQLIKRFTSISVREISGIEICDSIFHIKTTQVLDPTLLLSEQDYLMICNNQYLVNYSKTKDYIGFMLLDDKEKKNTFMQELSSKMKIPFVDIKGEKIKRFKMTFNKFNPIPLWLNYIRNATFIVTDSFHCAVFCIIFRKKFAVLTNEERGIRLINLLSKYDLNNLFYKSEKDLLDSAIWTKVFDYNMIHYKIEEEKQYSIDFLRKSLKIKN